MGHTAKIWVAHLVFLAAEALKIAPGCLIHGVFKSKECQPEYFYWL